MCEELLRVFKFGNKKNSEEKNRGNFGSLRKKNQFFFHFGGLVYHKTEHFVETHPHTQRYDA